MKYETEFDNKQLNCLQFALAFTKSQSSIEILLASFDKQLIWSIKKFIMDRSTHLTVRPKHLDQNLNRLDGDTSNNKPTATLQNQKAPPTLRNIVDNNRTKLYPFIQQNEYKYRNVINSTYRNSSTNDESCSSSDEEVKLSYENSDHELTLSSRLSAAEKKSGATTSEGFSISFFENMPPEMLFEIVSYLNDPPAAAKNLMNFSSVCKFNREFFPELLSIGSMEEVSFGITKSVIPNLLAKLAKDIKAQFTQADLDRLIHNYPYLTFDSSLQKNTIFTKRELEALRKILHHPELQGVRIINNHPKLDLGYGKNHEAYNNCGLELMNTLLTRENSSPIKVDFICNNWMPPFDYGFQINEKSLDLIKKIQDSGDKCSSVIFGGINLSRNPAIGSSYPFNENDLISIQAKEYQFNYVKMMCNIALTHSAHTISLHGFKLSDSQLGLILDEIQLCDKSTLQHLDLSENYINESAAESLSALLQSENTSLKTLQLNDGDISVEAYIILCEALKNNQSLKLIEIRNVFYLDDDHPIRNDTRVRLTEYSWE